MVYTDSSTKAGAAANTSILGLAPTVMIMTLESTRVTNLPSFHLCEFKQDSYFSNSGK
jgi:hypothetical protein